MSNQLRPINNPVKRSLTVQELKQLTALRIAQGGGNVVGMGQAHQSSSCRIPTSQGLTQESSSLRIAANSNIHQNGMRQEQPRQQYNSYQQKLYQQQPQAQHQFSSYHAQNQTRSSAYQQIYTHNIPQDPLESLYPPDSASGLYQHQQQRMQQQQQHHQHHRQQRTNYQGIRPQQNLPMKGRTVDEIKEMTRQRLLMEQQQRQLQQQQQQQQRGDVPISPLSSHRSEEDRVLQGATPLHANRWPLHSDTREQQQHVATPPSMSSASSMSGTSSSLSGEWAPDSFASGPPGSINSQHQHQHQRFYQQQCPQQSSPQELLVPRSIVQQPPYAQQQQPYAQQQQQQQQLYVPQGHIVQIACPDDRIQTSGESAYDVTVEDNVSRTSGGSGYHRQSQQQHHQSHHQSHHHQQYRHEHPQYRHEHQQLDLQGREPADLPLHDRFARAQIADAHAAYNAAAAGGGSPTDTTSVENSTTSRDYLPTPVQPLKLDVLGKSKSLGALAYNQLHSADFFGKGENYKSSQVLASTSCDEAEEEAFASIPMYSAPQEALMWAASSGSASSLDSGMNAVKDDDSSAHMTGTMLRGRSNSNLTAVRRDSHSSVGSGGHNSVGNGSGAGSVGGLGPITSRPSNTSLPSLGVDSSASDAISPAHPLLRKPLVSGSVGCADSDSPLPLSSPVVSATAKKPLTLSPLVKSPSQLDAAAIKSSPSPTMPLMLSVVGRNPSLSSLGSVESPSSGRRPSNSLPNEVAWSVLTDSPRTVEKKQLPLFPSPVKSTMD